MATAFDDISEYQSKAQEAENVFNDIALNTRTQEELREPSTTLTFLTSLAQVKNTDSPLTALTEEALEGTRNLLRLGEEKTLRNQIAIRQQEKDLAGLSNLRSQMGNGLSTNDLNTIQKAYSNVLTYDLEKKSAIAIEREAIERIQQMAASDPTQARVLLDNLEKGDADQTVRDFNVKLQILRQRAEELDGEYQQQGWGKTVMNFVMNLIPLNYNFARSGVVGEGGLGSWLAVGEGLRDQSERLWSMDMDEFIEFTKKDGALMQSIRSNATTAFDITYDPAMAGEIIENLTSMTDNSRTWSNIWGGVEVASVVPWTRLTRVTRNLVASGAPREAARNLDNAIEAMDARGPAAMEKATGVTPEELADELSVSHIKPKPDDEVPMSEQVRVHREAAQQALKELFDPATGYRFNSADELQAAFEAVKESVGNRIGRSIKDFKLKQEVLPGGQQVHYVEYIFGKKDGHGFATKLAAQRSAAAKGVGDAEITQIVNTPMEIGAAAQHAKAGRTLRVFHGTRGEIIGDLRASSTGKLGAGLYVSDDAAVASSYARGTDGTQLRPLRINSSKIFGYDNLEGWTKADLDKALDELGFDTVDFYDRHGGRLDIINKGTKANPFRSRDVLRSLQDEANEMDAQSLDDYLDWTGEESLNTRLKEKGYEGVAGKWDNDREINVFDPNTAAPEFLPTQVFQDVSGQYFVRGRVNISDTQFFTNPLTPPSQGFLSRMFGRWIRSAPRITDEALHGRALEAGTYINRAHKAIQGNIMSTFGALPKQSREVVQQIALKGQNLERWFKPDEFSYLTERLVGRKATEQELDAYAKFKLYNDMDWELRNTAQYVDGIMKGKETVKFETVAGRFDGDAKIDYDLNVMPKERVYDASKNVHFTKQNNPLTRDRLNKMKNDGYVMVNLSDEPLTFPDGTRVNRILIKKHEVEISPLKREQLQYTEGGHRMYADKVFVKQGRKGKQPDTGSEYLLSPSTLRTAENIAEGKKWADTMNRARLAVKENPGIHETLLDDIFENNPGYPTGREFLDMVDEDIINLDNPFEAVWDRDLPSMYRQSGEDVTRLFDEDELGINGYYRTTGRMYTSRKGEILRNTKGEVAETIDPYDTLSTSLEQVTRQLGLFNYKVEGMERFANTYRKYLDVQPNHRFTSQILTEAKVRPDVPVELKNQIESQRASILNTLRFETPEDKLARQMWQNTAEWVIGSGDNAARKWAHDAVLWWQERNPISAIRGMVFDMKLGMFNPAQLLIQSSTMLSATALSPKYGMYGMAGIYPIHRYLLSQGSENILDTFAKRGVGKTMGFKSEQEFKEFARHLQTHGFADMNGSHIMINDYGPAAHFGSLGSKVDKARETGRVFFYTSETWNRIVAYRIAWGEAMDAGLKPNQMNFTADVLRRADDYSFNMTSESAAYWQKGVLSIPTQFWAYNLRMMDAMLGKRFTPAQRIRLATMQMGIAGTAGIPGLAALSEYLKQQNGSAPDIDSIAGVVDRGLIDFINYQMTGEDVAIGERVGTGGWATEVVKGLFGTSEYGEKSFMDIAGGASYSIGKKALQAGGSILGALADYSAAESGADMGEKAIVGEKFVQLLKEVSTFSNATKAMMIHQHGIYMSNKGTVLIHDLPPGQALYTLLSFRPEKAAEIGYLMAWDKNKQESIKEVATQLRNWRQQAITNPDLMEENMQKANALIRMLPVQDRPEVIKQTNRITDSSFYEHIERKVSEEQMKENMAEGLAE